MITHRPLQVLTGEDLPERTQTTQKLALQTGRGGGPHATTQSRNVLIWESNGVVWMSDDWNPEPRMRPPLRSQEEPRRGNAYQPRATLWVTKRPTISVS